MNAAVGNDVVDLTDPAIGRHHENERFVARVCSEDERLRVSTARDLWSLFAAKEAAYKALVKLGGSPGFGHRALRVAADLASVTWGDRRLALVVTGDRDHVHAVAWRGGGRPIARVARAGASGRGESEDARAGSSDGFGTQIIAAQVIGKRQGNRHALHGRPGGIKMWERGRIALEKRSG